MDERWMASYMDMVTVLMCMFIVLFAMSTVDQQKFEELRNSLAAGFGATKSEFADTADGVVVPPEQVDEDGEGFTDLDIAQMELDNLTALRDKIQTNLAAQGLLATVEFDIGERGLTVRLVSTETFFEANSDTLSTNVIAVLDAVAPPLAESPYKISVEGHADYRDPGGQFPTNWELSSGRSVQVLRHLVEQRAIPAERVASVGYGSAHPLSTGATADELALNRRVDVVALSGQPESIRQLIPGLIAESAAPVVEPAAPTSEPAAPTSEPAAPASDH
ncbi:OmpA/MotB family protein [Mycetocola miduiensis]|uniref:OmpA/MotB family protein n=1 Tax=Mycetocola miduiensis TaxID=995034 RepID=UPI003CCC29A1